jgi:hypothetical protein
VKFGLGRSIVGLDSLAYIARILSTELTLRHHSRVLISALISKYGFVKLDSGECESVKCSFGKTSGVLAPRYLEGKSVKYSFVETSAVLALKYWRAGAKADWLLSPSSEIDFSSPHSAHLTLMLVIASVVVCLDHAASARSF